MTGGDFLRAQIPSSTDPSRLRRMAQAEDLYALAFKVQHQPPSLALDIEVEKALRGLLARPSSPRTWTLAPDGVARTVERLCARAAEIMGRR